MLKIRLVRSGVSHKPSFRVVAIENRSKNDGKVVENLGVWNKLKDQLVVDRKRIGYWVDKGAKLSPLSFQTFKQVTMDQLLTYLLQNLLPDHPPAFEKNQTDGVIDYTISVPQENMGRIIGKNGRIIKALRNVLKIRATLEKIKVNLNLVEA